MINIVLPPVIIVLTIIPTEIVYALSKSQKFGEVIDLIRSMPVEARIIYDEESYLEWLLNLLNLRSN